MTHPDLLAQCLLKLKSREKLNEFLIDLLTEEETKDILNRIRVALYLTEGLSYRKIHDLTGMSTRTITRIAKFLNRNNSGYVSFSQDCGPKLKKELL